MLHGMYLLSQPFCNIQTTTDSLVLLAERVMKYIFLFYENCGMKDISRID